MKQKLTFKNLEKLLKGLDPKEINEIFIGMSVGYQHQKVKYFESNPLIQNNPIVKSNKRFVTVSLKDKMYTINKNKKFLVNFEKKTIKKITKKNEEMFFFYREYLENEEFTPKIQLLKKSSTGEK